LKTVSRSEVQRIYLRKDVIHHHHQKISRYIPQRNKRKIAKLQRTNRTHNTLILPIGSRVSIVSPAVASHIVHRSNRLAHPSLLHPWHISLRGPQMHPYARDFFLELCENLRGWRHSAHDWPSRCSRDRPPGQCLEGCWGTEGDARDKASREKCESATKRRRETEVDRDK